MSVFWGIVFEKLREESRESQMALRPIEAAIATSAAACLVDYRLTPKRFTPGFEKELSRWSLFATYSAFALGLAGTAILARK